MNAPSEDIVDYLFDQGLGTLGSELFTDIMPTGPDNCIVIRDTGGFDRETGFDADYNYEKPTVQVVVRNKAKLAAYAKMREITALLHKNIDIKKGGVRYICIWQQGDILTLGTDDKNRIELSVNFRIHRTNV